MQNRSRHQPPRPMRQQAKPKKQLLSRRDFIALLGLGTACGAIGGLTGGYLLLSDDKMVSAGLPTPTHDPQRLKIFKSAERPPIKRRAEWGARAVDTTAENESGTYSLENVEGYRVYDGELRVVYNTIVIHHSSLYKGDDDTTIKAIQDLHMDDRKWADVAYHFLVGKNGVIYEGRKFFARGTHTEYRNTGTLGICLMGNFEEEEPTAAQLESTQMIVNYMALRVTATHLAGHKDFNDSTLCPGKNLYPKLDQIAQKAFLTYSTDGYVAPPEQLITPTADPNSISAIISGCDCGCCGDIS